MPLVVDFMFHILLGTLGSWHFFAAYSTLVSLMCSRCLNVSAIDTQDLHSSFPGFLASLMQNYYLPFHGVLELFHHNQLF